MLALDKATDPEHRTDSQNFSAEAITEIRAFANAEGLPLPKNARRWRSKDDAQEAQEPIRPTHLQQREAGEDDRQRQLYDMIWKWEVASQLADAEYHGSLTWSELKPDEPSRFSPHDPLQLVDARFAKPFRVRSGIDDAPIEDGVLRLTREGPDIVL